MKAKLKHWSEILHHSNRRLDTDGDIVRRDGFKIYTVDMEKSLNSDRVVEVTNLGFGILMSL